MIALDTNILARYIVEPKTPQGEIAQRILEDRLAPEVPGFVSTVVFVELLWVLERRYGVEPEKCRGIVRLLIDMPQLVIEHADLVERALNSPHRDIADIILHQVGRAAGCTTTLTFDKRFARVEGVELAS